MSSISQKTRVPSYTPTLPWYKKQAFINAVRITLSFAIIIPLALIYLAPYVGMLSTALKTPREIFTFPPKLIPDDIQWQNFREGWSTYVPFNTYLFNSLKITINNVIGNLVSCTLAAFAFARLRARGKRFLFPIVLVSMIMPFQALLVPQFILFTRLGLTNTHWPLMLPAWFGFPFFIFLLRQFFMTLPKELDEAALIDGANWLQILWYVAIPLSKPALVSVAIFAFVGNWNNYLAPLIFLRDDELYTLPLGLTQFQGQFGNVAYHYMMSNAVLILLPVVILFFFSQRLFIEGITLTGSK
ncbi:MAG: carbohydrate ABC transporter permease [Deinococcota bacterium]